MRLPVPITAIVGAPIGGRGRGAEVEIGTAVGEAFSQRVADQPEPPLLREHRLIGEVEHVCSPVCSRRRDHRPRRIIADPGQRKTVLRVAVQLLSPTQQQHGHHFVLLGGFGQRRPHHLRVMLAVDQRKCPSHGHRPGAGENFS